MEPIYDNTLDDKAGHINDMFHETLNIQYTWLDECICDRGGKVTFWIKEIL